MAEMLVMQLSVIVRERAEAGKRLGSSPHGPGAGPGHRRSRSQMPAGRRIWDRDRAFPGRHQRHGCDIDDIEHAKLRRFGDPRIHAPLVCGSVSCPILRREPYTGPGLTDQLDEQLTYFLASGGSQVDRDQALVTLSRVFLWFGADFVGPRRMPTFLPACRSSILASLLPWLDAGIGEWVELTSPRIEFQRYDWGLRCVVSKRT